MGRLDGKIAIVTGAAREIGFATAKLNKHLVVHLAADVTDPVQCRQYVNACGERFGGVDVLIDNAGIDGTMAPLLELTDKDFDKVLDVNLKGAWYGIKYAAPMKIRVNTVNPGPIETRMMRSIEKQAAPEAPEEVKSAFVGKVPLGRYGDPEEVAALMLFLASDDASYCSGGVYLVDGGFNAG